MPEITTFQVTTVDGSVDTSSDEFKVAQIHMALRSQLRAHGVTEDSIDTISGCVEESIGLETNLDINKIRDIESAVINVGDLEIVYFQS